jgi:hypothetical protein
MGKKKTDLYCIIYNKLKNETKKERAVIEYRIEAELKTDIENDFFIYEGKTFTLRDCYTTILECIKDLLIENP